MEPRYPQYIRLKNHIVGLEGIKTISFSSFVPYAMPEDKRVHCVCIAYNDSTNVNIELESKEESIQIFDKIADQMGLK